MIQYVTMNTSIRCPKCGHELEITEALTSEIQRKLISELSKKHSSELEDMRRNTESRLKKQLSEESNKEISLLEKRLSEKNLEVEKFREYEIKLREDTRRLEEREKSLRLEVSRKIDEEKKKLEETILRHAQEEYRLKDMEKEKIIRDLQKSLEDAQRKASQSSQQLQGEVQELDLEESLRQNFIFDVIEAVGKGVRGADVRQTVRTQRGNSCGIILWESKRTKAWSDEWIGKLKDDLRVSKANIPIIVTSQLPSEAAKGFGVKGGVYIVSYSLMMPVAELLRQKLIDIAREKFVVQNRGSKADELYSYITSHDFRQQIESTVEVYQEMHQQIMKERALYERSWKTRETQAQRLMQATAGIIGSMRGLVGQSIPQIKGMDTDEVDSSESLNTTDKLL